jgi:hypothetical protein
MKQGPPRVENRRGIANSTREGRRGGVVGIDWATRRAAWCAFDAAGALLGEGLIPADLGYAANIRCYTAPEEPVRFNAPLTHQSLYLEHDIPVACAPPERAGIRLGKPKKAKLAHTKSRRAAARANRVAAVSVQAPGTQTSFPAAESLPADLLA